MQVLAPFEVTSTKATVAGDLIRLLRRDLPLAIVLKVADGKRVLGVISEGAMGAVTPFHFVPERDFPCLRYPSTWCLELVEAGLGYQDYGLFSGLAGVVHVGSTGNVINFDNHPENFRENPLTVNLSSFEWDDVQQNSVPFPRWRIWSDPSDRLRAGASPVFEMHARLPEPR